MATSEHTGKSVRPVPKPTNGRRRYTKEDALTDRDFQLLLEGAAELDEYYAKQARFVVLVGGRLGLRRAEIAHLHESWIDWNRSMIEIPRFDGCEKGQDGGPCGDCRAKARQQVDHADGSITMEQALSERWGPKTDAAARSVPFAFDPRVELVVERFLQDDRYDGWPLSVMAVTRRVKAAAEASPLDDSDVYVHALRATAATYHAARGLDALPLKSLMGWESLETAKNYVASSGERTARALNAVHAR